MAGFVRFLARRAFFRKRALKQNSIRQMTFSLFQKRATAWLFWLAAFSFSLAAQKNDSLQPLPPFHPDRVKTVDLKHVSLDLAFDFGQKAAFGSATLELTLFKKGKKVCLDAAHLAISSVELIEKGGLKKLVFDASKCPADDGLEIILPRKMAAKKPFSLRINYRTTWPNLSDPTALGGSVGKGLRFFERASADLARRKQVWSASEIDGARFWFPTHDAFDDFFTSEIRATVETGLTVVSNGSLVEKTANADGSTTFFWRCETAHAAHQTSIAVGDWTDVLHGLFWRRRLKNRWLKRIGRAFFTPLF